MPRLGREDIDLALASASRKLVTKGLVSRWLSLPARHAATMLPKKSRPTAWQRGTEDSAPWGHLVPYPAPQMETVRRDTTRALEWLYGQPPSLDRLGKGWLDTPPQFTSLYPAQGTILPPAPASTGWS